MIISLSTKHLQNISSINIVFHKITQLPQREWDIEPKHFLSIFNWCKANLASFRIYFDDGDNLDLLSGMLDEISSYTTLAIVTDDVGEDGFLSWDELTILKSKGFNIASHSVSHPSLCTYDSNNKKKLINPPNGAYKTSPRGLSLLTVSQIRYQLIESKKNILSHGLAVNEFVFPYGLYSAQTLSVASKVDMYSYYATCDEKLYKGGNLIPRILMRGNRPPNENILCLTKLIAK